MPSATWTNLSSLILTSQFLVGCSSGEDSPPQRWIAADPEESFSAERLSGSRELFRWSFRNAAELDTWRLHGVDPEAGLTAEGLVVRSSTGDPQLSRKVDIDAGAIDLIRVGIAGLEKGRVAIFWAGRSEPFQVTKSIRLPPGEGGDRSPEFKVFEFRVSEHPEWEGRVARLRLDPTSLAGERVVVRWLAGATEGMAQTEIREMAGKPWRVELGNDRRNALLTVPGHSLEREIVIPMGGRLRLAYGRVCSTGSTSARLAPVRLQVLVEARGHEAEVVWETRLDRDDRSRAMEWNEAVIDLSRYGGRRAMVSLQTTAARPSDQLPCVVALANPEVTSETFEQQGPNVILISLDTLRADRLSRYGNRRNTSPQIDVWARERGTTFATAIAQSNWTLPSHISMLTGLDALSHGVNFDSPAPASLTFLAEVFRQAGYKTMAITGGGYMASGWGFTQGFDRYVDWPRGDRERELDENLNRFLKWLSGHTDRRFFALFHTYEPHGPYRPRRPYFERFYDGALEDRVEDLEWDVPKSITAVDRRRVESVWRQRPDQAEPSSDETQALVSALYDAGVAYTDAQMGRLFRALRELGLEDRTIVVLTSDHGEALGEHGGLRGHQYAYDHTLLVPLIIAAPGLDASGRTVPAQVRSIDIAPTLLELAGLAPLEGIDGQSLVPLMRGEDASHNPEAWSYHLKANWGVALRIDNKLKYIYNDAPWSGLRARESLYRLDEDPAEVHDVAQGSREAGFLRRRVLERLATVPTFRVQLRSAPDQRLHGRLKGPPVHPKRVKSLDVPCDCLQWVPPDMTDFEVPAGANYTVLFHGVPEGTLRIENLAVEGRPEIESSASVELDPRALEGAQTLSLVDGKWELQNGYRPSQVPSLTFWWSSDVAVGATDLAAKDPELAGQLRALGYMN